MKLKSLTLVFCIVYLCFAMVSAEDQLGQQREPLTADDVISLYSNRHYRTINTNSIQFIVSPDGTHVYAFADGLYRISDGHHYNQFVNIIFNPAGDYFIQQNSGLYSLSSKDRILGFDSQAVFSSNGLYIGIERVGVYELKNMQLIFETTSDEILFSPQNDVVTTINGVYSLADGSQLFQSQGHIVSFSSNGEYFISGTNVYRSTDGALLVETRDVVMLSPNGSYAVSLGDAVYSIRTGEKLYDIDITPTMNPPYFSPDGEYIVFEENGVYKLNDGLRVFDTDDVTFSSDGDLIAVGYEGVYDLNNSEAIFELDGDITSFGGFSPNDNYLSTRDGIFSIATGHKIIDRGFGAEFSPNSELVALDNIGVYRLNDGEMILTLNGVVNRFTSDSRYLSVGFIDNIGIYRLSDGQYFGGIQFLSIQHGILTNGNALIIVGMQIA